jgi:ribosomal protein S18 acetylase RimI-like enzyme
MIRLLTIDDVDAFRDLRLEALRDSPHVFASSFEDEARFTRGDFLRRMEPTETSWMLGAFPAGAGLVGCLGCYRERGVKVNHRAHLWGMFVKPAHRREGFGRQLVTAALDRARSMAGVTQLELFVASGNEGAASLYESLGFERSGVHPRALCIDGRYFDETLYVHSCDLLSS